MSIPGERGGEPVIINAAGRLTSQFSLAELQYDTSMTYGGYTDAAGWFTGIELRKIHTYDAQKNMLSQVDQNNCSFVNDYRSNYGRQLYHYPDSQSLLPGNATAKQL